MSSIIHQLVLASESPRRKDLLQKAGFSFHVFSVKVSENLEKNLTVDEQILAIARRKAEASFQAYKPSKQEHFLILSADTMVVVDGIPLGKPRDEGEATEFLSLLSSRDHLVKTAVVIMEGSSSSRECLKMKHGLQTTQVFFRHINEREILEYIESGEPMDKAGAYGIQGGGGNFVEKVIGPFDNVIGLPIELVKNLLQEGAWKLKK